MADETKKPDVSAMMATPEFQEAVQKAASKAAAEAVASLAKASNGMNVDDATKAFFSTMALQIAEISDQGTSRKRVAPEVLARRAAAAEKCAKLVTETRLKGLKPEYQVVSKIYFGERIIDPWRRQPDKTVVPQEIIWTGIPCEGLKPLNDIAHDIYALYKESIGSTEKLKSIKGSHGGIVAPDNRPPWMTPGGLVVKGDAPPRLAVGQPQDHSPEAADNNDPNAPEVRILGTVAQPARRNYQNPAEAMAARVAQ